MKLRAAFAKSLAKQHQQQALCYFHLNFRTAFLFCRSFVLVICLGWRTDSGTGRWADGQMISGHFNGLMKKHTHAHTNTKKAPQKEKGNWEAGRVFSFSFSRFWCSHNGNQRFFLFFFFLSFISLISKIWQKLTKKIAKLSPNLQ